MHIFFLFNVFLFRQVWEKIEAETSSLRFFFSCQLSFFMIYHWNPITINFSQKIPVYSLNFPCTLSYFEKKWPAGKKVIQKPGQVDDSISAGRSSGIHNDPVVMNAAGRDSDTQACSLHVSMCVLVCGGGAHADAELKGKSFMNIQDPGFADVDQAVLAARVILW